ncbi:hypothetical protein CC79DRAFT_462977 [Sarocladium strictum]
MFCSLFWLPIYITVFPLARGLVTWCRSWRCSIVPRGKDSWYARTTAVTSSASHADKTILIPPYPIIHPPFTPQSLLLPPHRTRTTKIKGTRRKPSPSLHEFQNAHAKPGPVNATSRCKALLKPDTQEARTKSRKDESKRVI